MLFIFLQKHIDILFVKFILFLTTFFLSYYSNLNISLTRQLIRFVYFIQDFVSTPQQLQTKAYIQKYLRTLITYLQVANMLIHLEIYFSFRADPIQRPVAVGGAIN